MKIEGDETKCFRKYCHYPLSAKLSDIERYRNTTKHKKARQTLIYFETVSNDVQEIEGCVSLFVAEHCWFRVVDPLSEL